MRSDCLLYGRIMRHRARNDKGVVAGKRHHAHQQ
jgi:hypothetical protein